MANLQHIFTVVLLIEMPNWKHLSLCNQ